MRKNTLSVFLLFLFTIFFQNCTTSSKTQVATKEEKGVNQKQEEGLTADQLEKIGNAFLLTSVSDDPTYGFSEKNAINVANKKHPDNLAGNEHLYMNALRGPNGEKVTYRRISSCCPRPSPNGFMGSALLDKYETKIEGSSKVYILYLNMYDPGTLKAPLGFSFIK